MSVNTARLVSSALLDPTYWEDEEQAEQAREQAEQAREQIRVAEARAADLEAELTRLRRMLDARQ
jgi:hypothetical protein